MRGTDLSIYGLQIPEVMDFLCNDLPCPFFRVHYIYSLPSAGQTLPYKGSTKALPRRRTSMQIINHQNPRLQLALWRVLLMPLESRTSTAACNMKSRLPSAFSLTSAGDGRLTSFQWYAQSWSNTSEFTPCGSSICHVNSAHVLCTGSALGIPSSYECPPVVAVAALVLVNCRESGSRDSSPPISISTQRSEKIQ